MAEICQVGSIYTTEKGKFYPSGLVTCLDLSNDEMKILIVQIKPEVCLFVATVV